MKKAISRFLVFLLVLNLAGYYPLYLYQLKQVKSEMRQKIKSLPGEALSVLTFSAEGYSQLEWENAHEFFYANEIYDVVRTESKGGMIKIFCVKDGDEKELFNRLSEQSKRNSSDPAGEHSNNLFKHFLSEFVPVASPLVDVQFCMIRQAYPVSENHYSLVEGENPSPPPRRS